MEIFKLEGLSFAYPGRGKKALSNVSLSVSEGEFITVLGQSGSGKTTLLRLLKPELSPHGILTGEILYKGAPIKACTQKASAAQIGFVMQNPESQIVTDRVWHELAFGAESLGLPSEEIRARVSEMASFFGIQNWFYRNTAELSGGEKQLLNLAAVMVAKPKVLILDEPTSRLDPIAASEFIGLVTKINRELGTTVIMSEHRTEEALPSSDRVIVMDGGAVAADAAPEEVGTRLSAVRHIMYEALPAPTRVFGALGEDKLPVTVRDGRTRLAACLFEKAPRQIKRAKRAVSAETVLEAKEVFFRYGRENPYAVRDLSMKVKKGELYAIMGGNGTGKSTALSLFAGIKEPERGKLQINGRTALLPQSPEILFTKNTVGEVILSAAELLPEEERAQAAEKVVSLCRLTELTDANPYDLSGGERQRVALAAVLLTGADILLLDEPTKGMDAHFKRIFAGILKKLTADGVTILTVSHDVDFCAEYADSVALFFDGAVTSEGAPEEFFPKNRFYTTAACRMADGILPGAVTVGDIIYALGAEEEKPHEDEPSLPVRQKSAQAKKPKRNKKRIAFGVLFAVLFIASAFMQDGLKAHIGSLGARGSALALAGLALLAFFPKKNGGVIKITGVKRPSLRACIIGAMLILVAVPVTVLAGIYFLEDRRYYFISILIVLEAIACFWLNFEKRRPGARELVLISVLSALAVAGRAAFFMLPEFKPVLAIVIISGVVFGGETGFLVGAAAGFVSNFFFGQGPWTPWQMFGFGIVGFLAGVVLRGRFVPKTRLTLSIFGAAAALLIYGPVLNTASVMMVTPKLTLGALYTYMAAGLPMDLIHAAATFVFLWFLSQPMTEKLERLKTKYGLLQQ